MGSATDKSSNGGDEKKQRPGIPEGFDVADVVSLEALINVLIEKGICTPQELFEAEKSRRSYMDKAKNISLVRTDRSQSTESQSSSRRKQSWLKRKMSKKRWSRRLGSALFGWEWKKVRNNSRVMHVENLRK